MIQLSRRRAILYSAGLISLGAVVGCLGLVFAVVIVFFGGGWSAV